MTRPVASGVRPDVWPDGTLVGPYEAARRLQARAGRWVVWYGPATRHFWATPRRPGRMVLVEAPTTDGLVNAMAWLAPQLMDTAGGSDGR